MVDLLKANWGELLVGAMAFFKVLANVTPTPRDNKVFGCLDDIVNFIVKDKIIK